MIGQLHQVRAGQKCENLATRPHGLVPGTCIQEAILMSPEKLFALDMPRLVKPIELDDKLSSALFAFEVQEPDFRSHFSPITEDIFC